MLSATINPLERIKSIRLSSRSPVTEKPKKKRTSKDLKKSCQSPKADPRPDPAHTNQTSHYRLTYHSSSCSDTGDASMLPSTINPPERIKIIRLNSSSPVIDNEKKKRTSKDVKKNYQSPRADPHPHPDPISIIRQSRIPRGFQQVYISANRDEDIHHYLPRASVPPVQRQPPRRTRSCLSSTSLNAFRDEPVRRNTKRTVSFGRVEGVTVENISLENKSSLWFSRDEYSVMRHEAFQIAHATRNNKGTTKEESSHTSFRGLEKFIDMNSMTQQVARISVLEHHDLAMYSLASRRAVQMARQLADKDAVEAFLIQKECYRDRLPPQHRARGKLLNP